MKIKFATLGLVVCVSVFSFFYLSKDESSQNKIRVASSSSENLSSAAPVMRDLAAQDSQVKQSADRAVTEDIIVFASTNEEAEIVASDFYREIFSIVGLEDGYINDVQTGEGIKVDNYFNVDVQRSLFIPLFSMNKVVGVAIFREYTAGEKELGSMEEIDADWDSYPPVKLYDAEFALNSEHPELNFKNISGYYYIEDRGVPYYLFEANDGYSTKYYLVSAYSNRVVIKADRISDEILDDSTPPVRLSEEGLIELDESLISGLSEEDLNQLKSGIDLTNRYINDGIMRFDENLNVTYDGRKKMMENDNIFSSDVGDASSDEGIIIAE